MAKFSLDDADVRFFEGQVGEHIHEWHFPELAPPGMKNFAWCEIDGCAVTLSIADVKYRLNLWERQNDKTS